MVPILLYLSSAFCRGIGGSLPRYLRNFEGTTCLSVLESAVMEFGHPWTERPDPETEVSEAEPRPAHVEPTLSPTGGLPAIMGEGLVGLRHLVRVLALLHCAAFVPGRRQNLGGEFIGEGMIGALRGVTDQPARGERVAALRTN